MSNFYKLSFVRVSLNTHISNTKISGNLVCKFLFSKIKTVSRGFLWASIFRSLFPLLTLSLKSSQLNEQDLKHLSPCRDIRLLKRLAQGTPP